MRATQVQLASASPLGGWIDNDDIIGDNDGLHYPRCAAGKIALAKRFAANAIELIRE